MVRLAFDRFPEAVSNRIGAAVRGKIVEVHRVVRSVSPEVGNRDRAADRRRRLARFRQTGIAGSPIIVIGRDHDPRIRKPRAHGLGDRQQVATIERDGDSVPRGLVHAGAGREALRDAEHVARFADQEAAALYPPAGQEPLRSGLADELQVQEPIGRRIEERYHEQRSAMKPGAVRGNALSDQVGMRAAVDGRLFPDRARAIGGFRLPPGLIGFPLGSGSFDPAPMFLFFGRRKRSSDIGAPVLPADPVAPVLKTAGRHAVEVQDIGRVALTAAPDSIAAVQLPVRDQVRRRNNVAARQRGPELQVRRIGVRCRGHGAHAPLNSAAAARRASALSAFSLCLNSLVRFLIEGRLLVGASAGLRRFGGGKSSSAETADFRLDRSEASRRAAASQAASGAGRSELRGRPRPRFGTGGSSTGRRRASNHSSRSLSRMPRRRSETSKTAGPFPSAIWR